LLPTTLSTDISSNTTRLQTDRKGWRKTIVGNVTQHARAIVADKNPAFAARKAPKAAGSRQRPAFVDAKPEAQA
jgi:hypothetical protein